MTSVAAPPDATRPPDSIQPPPGEPPPYVEPEIEAETNVVAASSSLTYPSLVVPGVALAAAVVYLLVPGRTVGIAALGVNLGLLAVAVLDAAALARKSQVRAGRALPAVFSLGHRHPFEIRIHLASGSLSATVVQTGTTGLEVMTPSERHEPAGGFPVKVDARPGSAGTADYVVRPRLRGRHRLPPMTVRATGRLGLVHRRFVFDPDDRIAVYPDLDDVRKAELALRRSRILETGLRTRRLIGQGTEFDSLREYRQDDDIRQINWHATARLNKPIANQYRIERNQTVIALLDCGRLMSTPVGSWSRLDLALANIAGIARICEKLEDRMGAIAFDERIRRNLAPRRSGVNAVLATLYDLEASMGESDYDRAFAEVAQSKRALVILFTDILEEGAARPLITALPTLLLRHEVVVASLRDPEIDAALDTAPHTPGDAYRQAAAMSISDQRRVAIRNITSLGAGVVEAAPEEMTPSLIDAYLRLKGSMRL